MTSYISSSKPQLKLFQSSKIVQTISESFTAHEFKILKTIDITGLEANDLTILIYGNYVIDDSDINGTISSYLHKAPEGIGLNANLASGTRAFPVYYKIVGNQLNIGLVDSVGVGATIIAPFNDAIIYYSVFYF